MKLLLTSAGLSHKVIGRTLQQMVDKPASETKVAFIPTAANVEGGNRHWLIRQLLDLWQYGFSWIDIVDPSADGVDWQTRLADVDVLYVTGGNTFHLLDQVRKTGFDKWLHENIEKKVYVGGSASTILMTPTIAVAGLEPIKAYAATTENPVYAIDDATAIQVVDKRVTVVSAGSWKLYDK